MKVKNNYLLFGFETLSFIILNLFKNDIIFFVNRNFSFIASVLLGFFLSFVSFSYILSGFIIIASILKKHKVTAFIMFISLISTIYIVYFFPLTNVYLNLNYDINKESRNKTIELIKNEEINYRIDMNEYLAPIKNVSYTKTILIQDENDVLKVLFYVYRGTFVESIIIYSSDDSGLVAGDFSNTLPPNMSYKFCDVNRISSNWYSAKIIN